MRHDRHSAARYDGPVSPDLLDHCVSHLREYDLPMQVTADGLSLDLPQACMTFRRDAAGFDVSITAENDLMLHQARENFLYLIDHVQPGASEVLRWQGTVARNEAPPNLHHGEVLSVRRVGRRFLRVELGCAGTEALSSGSGLHFSLLIPPDGRVPVWPRLDDNGRMVWPEGENRLHRAVYTFVAFEPAAARFTFDIFEHEGSRTTDWVRAATPGESVGIMGPGGGDFPAGDDLLIAGDETALPAIRRILECSDPARRGHAFIEVGENADRCEITAPESIAMTWVIRNTGETLWDHLSAASPGENSRYIWVAGERALVRRAKGRFRDGFGIGSTESCFSAYWVR